MYKWHVELYVGHDILHIGEPFVRHQPQSVVSFLTTLNDPSLTVVQVEAYHFWVSPDFDALTDEEEVLQYANNQLPILNGIMQLKFDTNICTIKIGDIYYPDPNDNDRLTRSAMRSTLVGSLYPDENFLLSKNVQKPSTQDMLLMARNNPLVAEALQHLATSHSWSSLEKIFEIIADDAGKSENSGKLPKGTFDKWTQGRDFGKNPPGRSFDFLQTAHSYHWSGFGARHSSVESRRRAGVNPMSLQEAIEYITDLFLKWLQSNP